MDTAQFVGGDGLLCDHVGCRGCGYDLMGLPADAGCPECGKLIAVSMVEAAKSEAAREEVARKLKVAEVWSGAAESGASMVGCAAFLRAIPAVYDPRPSAGVCLCTW